MDYHIADSPKMLRETLCVAQSRIGNSGMDEGRKKEHIDRLQRLIDECDRHRPLGIGGKHGDLHTDTCGCVDKEVGKTSMTREEFEEILGQPIMSWQWDRITTTGSLLSKEKNI